MQLFIALSFLFFILSSSFFYSLVYLFIFFIWLGLFLSVYSLEMFTGFFWVVELSVFFILLLFLFFLNYSSELSSSGRPYLPLAVLAACSLVPLQDDYSVSLGVLNFSSLYEDYYAAAQDSSMSDVHGLYLSYYVFNSPLLVIFGFFIFLVSVVCVLLLKASQACYAESAGSVLSVLKFFEDLLSFELLSSQNLSIQVLRLPIESSLNSPPNGWFNSNQD